MISFLIKELSYQTPFFGNIFKIEVLNFYEDICLTFPISVWCEIPSNINLSNLFWLKSDTSKTFPTSRKQVFWGFLATKYEEALQHLSEDQEQRCKFMIILFIPLLQWKCTRNVHLINILCLFNNLFTGHWHSLLILWFNSIKLFR